MESAHASSLGHFHAYQTISKRSTISIKNGLITERWPGTGHPMVIESEGTMSGTMGMVVAPDDIEPIYTAFSGTMVITLLLMEGESEEFYEYFEDNCD